MSKITDGPYFVIDFTDDKVNSAPTARDIYVSCTWPDVLFICGMEPGVTGTIEEARANAHLFAASWDLLQFAKAQLVDAGACIEAAAAMSARGPIKWDITNLVARRDEIATLVAKAEGRQAPMQMEPAK